MEPIYIVFGMTGEYSDRREWVVCAYRDESAAQVHVTKASEVARTWMILQETDYDTFFDLRWDDALLSPYDPNLQMDYNGTHYYYRKTFILTTLDDVANIEKGV